VEATSNLAEALGAVVPIPVCALVLEIKKKAKMSKMTFFIGASQK
jgi:hypothetical protein